MKLNVAADVLPELVTDAVLPGAPVVVVPTVTVAAAPLVPAAPVAPCGPVGPTGPPLGPIGPVGPCGTTKLNVAAELEPELVTEAVDPGAPVVVVPTVMVAAAPLEPVAPAGPVAPTGPVGPAAIPTGPCISHAPKIVVVPVPTVFWIDIAIYVPAVIVGVWTMSLQVVAGPTTLQVNPVDVIVPADVGELTRVNVNVVPLATVVPVNCTNRFVATPVWGEATAAAVKPAVPVAGTKGPTTLLYAAVVVTPYPV